MILILLVAVVGLSFAVCPTGGGASLDMSAETVEKQGKKYRRADVLIFIPIDKRVLKEGFSALKQEVSLTPLGDGTYEVSVVLRNVSDSVVEGAFLEQEVGDGTPLPEEIRASRILSRTPFIFEPVSLYPTDVRDRRLVVKLPPLKPAEELELSYILRSETQPRAPEVHGVPLFTEERRERVYILVAKYSFLFSYGRTKTSDVNLENVRDVLEGFKKAGLKPIVKVVGLADGRTSNPKRNAEIASERARFVAREILGENYACYMRRGFADRVR